MNGDARDVTFGDGLGDRLFRSNLAATYYDMCCFANLTLLVETHKWLTKLKKLATRGCLISCQWYVIKAKSCFSSSPEEFTPQRKPPTLIPGANHQSSDQFFDTLVLCLHSSIGLSLPYYIFELTQLYYGRLAFLIMRLQYHYVTSHLDYFSFIR